ncbi:hypothetical protein C8Q75DRAFT_876016 [Abortiporus biennis]|nr:hypothetical protein C8Q75DRAFT_876016 [Abortiporus biennis]
MAAPQSYLPTTDRLASSFSPNEDVQIIAEKFISNLAEQVKTNNIPGILDLIHPDAWWRDLFALTWDTRSFQGHEKIKKFLEDRLEISKLSNIKFVSAQLDKPFPDLEWITTVFDFEAGPIIGKGVIRLVSDGVPKAFVLFTNLTSLKDFPENIGPRRDFLPNHGKWIEQRHRETEFLDGDPEVLIIGGGQAGLDTAARLKTLGVSNLIIEKQSRVGDQWRNRYAALCLHDPVWFDHLPYLPFPETWPVYTPAQKLAAWFESYVEALELNVWTSAVATKAYRDEATNKWVVTVKRGENGTERVFNVDHVIFALGIGAGAPNIPNIPGKEDFQGQVLHSTQHKKATDHVGKKVVIVGACTSAHDIAADYVENGVDVTIYQRSSTYIMTTKEGMPRYLKPLYWEGGPPTEVADLFGNSLPHNFNKLLLQRISAQIEEADRELLDGLKETGFKLNKGVDDAGFLYNGLVRVGGYYLDVGASQLIIDGKIKLKNDSQIERFTQTGLKFEDGSELDADVVLYATGFADASEPISRIVGDEVSKKVPRIWGIDEEGEVNGCYRELGTPGLWYIMGNLAGCRFFSKHVALQIKAKQQGVFGTRYSAKSF